MARKVVAIVGSYRKGHTVDSAVDAILSGAREHGAETSKIYLTDKHIEFCTNCRDCAQQAGATRGKCSFSDEMSSVLDEIDAADSIVLGAPVNFFNVTAIFRRFMERLVPYAFYPWGAKGPATRTKATLKRAVLVSSSAMPGLLLPLATGAPRALRTTAKVLGAKPLGSLWIGLAALQPDQQLSPSTLRKANLLGAKLA